MVVLEPPQGSPLRAMSPMAARGAAADVFILDHEVDEPVLARLRARHPRLCIAAFAPFGLSGGVQPGMRILRCQDVRERVARASEYLRLDRAKGRC